MTIRILSGELFHIRFKNLGPCLAVVEMDAVDAGSFCEVNQFGDEKLPCFNLSIVEHDCVLVLDGLTVGAITDIASAVLV